MRKENNAISKTDLDSQIQHIQNVNSLIKTPVSIAIENSLKELKSIKNKSILRQNKQIADIIKENEKNVDWQSQYGVVDFDCCIQSIIDFNNKQIDILKQFLYSEITERREYSASKMCEIILSKIDEL